jgi:CheY-like chemotaxis protein
MWVTCGFERMKTLILVEDNQDNADLIRDLLGERYRIVAFPDGPSALAALTKAGAVTPDLLLLDISLPGLDGTSLLRQLRLRPQLMSIPAVALTAHAMKSDRENLIRAGFNGYVSKPIVDERLLLEAIEANTMDSDQAAA